jgi:G3E family GTPase
VTSGRPAIAASEPGVSDPADAAVPLTLLTGFLGAGKTTLVNRALNGEFGGRIGVLVNDFGALNIDSGLIAGQAEGVVSLENGCICCSLRGDLVAAVMRLLDRPDAPQRVLLEASGVADPAPVAGTFLAPAFRRRLRLDAAVCVVDAEQALRTPALEALQLRQIGFSDLVILNKTDLAGPPRVRRLAKRIRGEFQGARLLEAVRCEVPLEVLFSTPARAAAAGVAHASPQEASSVRFDSWSYETTAAFSADALHDLARQLPAAVYRAKGIVRIRGGRRRGDRRGVLQIVGRRADLVADRPWDDEMPASRLVFIGAAGELQPERIAALVADCLGDNQPETCTCGD